MPYADSASVTEAVRSWAGEALNAAADDDGWCLLLVNDARYIVAIGPEHRGEIDPTTELWSVSFQLRFRDTADLADRVAAAAGALRNADPTVTLDSDAEARVSFDGVFGRPTQPYGAEPTYPYVVKGDLGVDVSVPGTPEPFVL